MRCTKSAWCDWERTASLGSAEPDRSSNTSQSTPRPGRLSTRFGLLYDQLRAFQRNSVEFPDGFFRSTGILHTHEAEVPGLSSFSVTHNSCSLHIPKMSEKQFEVKFCYSISQTTYVDIHLLLGFNGETNTMPIICIEAIELQETSRRMNIHKVRII